MSSERVFPPPAPVTHDRAAPAAGWAWGGGAARPGAPQLQCALEKRRRRALVALAAHTRAAQSWHCAPAGRSPGRLCYKVASALRSRAPLAPAAGPPRPPLALTAPVPPSALRRPLWPARSAVRMHRPKRKAGADGASRIVAVRGATRASNAEPPALAAPICASDSPAPQFARLFNLTSSSSQTTTKQTPLGPRPPRRAVGPARNLPVRPLVCRRRSLRD